MFSKFIPSFSVIDIFCFYSVLGAVISCWMLSEYVLILGRRNSCLWGDEGEHHRHIFIFHHCSTIFLFHHCSTIILPFIWWPFVDWNDIAFFFVTSPETFQIIRKHLLVWCLRLSWDRNFAIPKIWNFRDLLKLGAVERGLWYRLILTFLIG